MNASAGTFPFGQPLLARPGHGPTPAHLFLLGAYPSAVHIKWIPPNPLRAIKALAVDNEPTPFWDGTDEAESVGQWLANVGWMHDWGIVKPAGRFNGSSGRDLEERYLARFDVKPRDAWITDCLDTYHMSVDVAARIADTYDVLRARLALPGVTLPAHPDESTIKSRAVGHVDRLRTELLAVTPEILVTLGNAALITAARVLEIPPPLVKLSHHPAKYGRPVNVTLRGNTIAWYPLAHPAAPPAYRKTHNQWTPADHSA